MARVSAITKPVDGEGMRTVVTLGAAVTALYFGRDIFIPITLAILLGFVLAPAVRRLHAIGLGRVFPVLLITTLAFAVILTVAGMLAAQVRDVAADLPQYEGTVIRKVQALRTFASDGALKSIEDVIHRVRRATAEAPTPKLTLDQAASPRDAGSAQAHPPAPVPVEIQQPETSPIEAAGAMLSPLLHPIATGGIVAIFVVFILLQREDLRNRLIRLVGASDLQRTTEAINDGAKRLSRYLVTQLLLNSSTGLAVGISTWIIGVPNPILWGILFGCMRFVPYLGPIIGGALPCLFAAALTAGWSITLWTAATILVIEVCVGQFVEPMLYGHHTGLSPVAVVVSATFWTVLWGPVGLLLSTPLTVCLVVVGRHVERLAFLDVLLGDRPPLTASETFYQRMLAQDPTEVSDRARDCLKSMTLTEYYDSVLLPGLLLAQDDVTGDRLSMGRQMEIRDATEDVIEDLDDQDEPDEKAPGARWRQFLPGANAASRSLAGPSGASAVTDAWQEPGAVLCIGGRGPLDDCAAQMLAQILRHRGLGAVTEDHQALSKSAVGSLDVSATRLICLSCLDGSSAAYLRFVLRRIKRRAPAAKILVGAWWLQAAPNDDGAKADLGFNEAHAATLVDAVRFCLAEAAALTIDELAARDASRPGLSAAS